MRWEPYAYQRRALEFLRENPRAALWVDMGLGKTSTCATFLAELLDECEVARVLIVSTPWIVKHVWPAEFAKWDHLTGVPWRRLAGSPVRRAEQYQEPWYGVELLTFDQLRSLGAWWRSVRPERRPRWPWDVVVFDESSKLRSVSSERFKALRPANGRGVLPLRRVVELTGSPAPEMLTGLWTQAYLLDGGRALGQSFEAFTERWFRPKANGYGVEALPFAEAQIHEAIAPLVLSMKAEEYLELPPLHVQDIEVELPRECRARYRELNRDMFTMLREKPVLAANTGVVVGKCQQLANGAVYHEDRSWSEAHDAKLDALEEIVEARLGEPLIVCYAYKSDAARIQARFTEAVHIKERGALERWDRGEVPMLLMHPGSAGHGLNLQDGGDMIVFFGLTYSWDTYSQAVARIAGGLRRKRPTYVRRIVCTRTVDEDILVSIATKRRVQDVLMQRVKEIRDDARRTCDVQRDRDPRPPAHRVGA